MSKYDIGAITIGVIIAFIAFVTVNNILIGAAIGLVFIAYYFLMLRKKLKAYLESLEKIHCCYNFINTFIISLSVKESLDDAFEASTRKVPNSLEIVLEGTKEMTTFQKMEYLQKYFNYGMYRMLVNLVSLHIEQGGNILKMADSLILETRRVEETILETESINKRKVGEFTILWALAFIVLLFIRFSLTSFYKNMLSSTIFVILLVVFYLIVLLSIHLFVSKYVKIPIKEENKYE